MGRHRRLDILAGIQTGVLGGIAMLVCFAMIAPLIGHSWWLVPNLMASPVYHRGLLRPGVATMIGMAWLLVGTGVFGVLNGLLTNGGRIFGLAVAASAYLLCYSFVWKRFAPLLLLQAPQPMLIAGFFVYGSVLGWHAYFRERLHH